MLPTLPAFLSDLFAGVVATLIFGAWAFLTRLFGPDAGEEFMDRLRRFGWPLVAAVFLGGAFVSAVVRGGTVSVVVLGALLMLAAFIMLARFGPAQRLHMHAPRPVQPVVRFFQAYPWRTIAATFFVASVVLYFTDVEGSTSPDASEQIVFVVGLDDTEMLAMRQILDELEPELGAEVFLMNVDPSRQVARLDSMVSSGDMKWDLVAVDNNQLGLLAVKGLVEELSELTEREDVIPEPLLPSLRPLLDFEDKEGIRHFYFAPFRANVRIGFYNHPKLGDDYSLDPPRTWTELLDSAKAFNEDGGVGRVSIAGFPGPPTAVTVFEFVTAAGGDPLTLDDDGSREAFEFLKEFEPYLAPQYPDTKFDTANEFLLDDVVYLVSNWTFGVQVVIFDGQKDEVKTYSGWKGPVDEVHVLGGDLLAVPKGAAHPDKAIELIKLLQTSETQRAFLSDLFWLPVRLDALTGVPAKLEPHFPAINEALARSEARPTIPQWPLVEDCLDGAFQALIVDGGDIDSLDEWSSSLKEITSIQYVGHRVEKTAGGVETWDSIATLHRTKPDILAALNRTTVRAPLNEGQIVIVLPDLAEQCPGASQ